MSLHTAAKNLSSKGRGRDTLLVHMSPREVQGLQALAKSQGGSLTINPDTGLVEAGFLEQALPIVAAAAATYFTAGAAAPALMGAGMGATSAGILAGAGAGALIGGGSAALQGKDVEQAALMGGVGGAISGGLGAYANAPNVFAGGAEAAATQQAATQVGTQAATSGVDAAGNAVSMASPTASTGFISPETGMATTPPPAANLNARDIEAQIGGAYGGRAPLNPYAGQTNAQITAATGIQPPPAPPPTYFQEANKLTQAGILSLPGLGAAAGENYNPPGSEQYDENSPYRMRLSNNFQGSTPVRPNPYYRATYAQGGMVAMAPGGLASIQNNMYPQSQQDATQFATPTQMPTSAEIVRSDYDAPTNPYSGEMMRMNNGGSAKSKKPKRTTAAQMAAMDSYEAALAGMNNAAAGAQMPSGTGAGLDPRMQLGQLGLKKGGIADLGGYSDGGRMLKGPGDGMSDSIPGVIGGRQPARLADGEFVVPADVVSHLGNGSTDAGAKKLYAMMAKVRQARTGKKKQAPAVKSAKYMPA
jgi:hypothetical protein